MSEEVHIEEHSSPIKTPRQLLIVVVLAFLVPIVLIVMLSQLLTTGVDTGKNNAALSEEAIAQRLKPVGIVEVIDANAPRVEKSGKEITEAVCTTCHGPGLLNAPKIGDKAAWAKPIGEGLDRLTQNAIKGIRAMPPRGGDASLNDIEVARAVAYMANQSGASFKEPAAKPVPAGKPAAAAVAAPAAAAAPAAPAQTAAAPAAAAPAPAKADANRGKAVYDASCVSCHGQGIAGAPKAGDKAAWAPRLKQGAAALHASAIKGKGAMPPKGGNLSLSDAEVTAAVDYLIGLAK